jgi:3-oxo-5-alpha-steroid 4-dehydrogenase 1
LIAFNFAALSFALWTFFNLVPRALNHHEWYNEYFDNYPKKRKAVLPYLL